MKPLFQSLLVVFYLSACGGGSDSATSSDTKSSSATGGESAQSKVAGESGSAKSQEMPVEAAVFGSANMVFEERVLDFGVVWDTEELVGSFKFQNRGDKALIISEVKPSCGCTSTELDRMRFEPGEKDAVELVWKPIGFGSQSKTITVKSNSQGPGIELLTIRATIKPFVTFSRQPLEFGVIEHSQAKSLRVTMRSTDPNLEIMNLVPAHKNLTVREVGHGDDGSYELELTFDEGTPWGQMNCAVRASVRGSIRPGDEPVEHTAILNVTASVFGDLRVEPTMFLVGHVLPGRSFQKQAVLTNATGQPFQVLSVSVINSKPPGIRVRAEAINGDPSQGYNLIVNGDAGDYLGLIRGQVMVQTNIPGEIERQLALMGIVRQ